MRRLPSLTALRTFECAARHAHFGRAAAELCVTDSAVSHQIRQLGEQLGTALLPAKADRLCRRPPHGVCSKRLNCAVRVYLSPGPDLVWMPLAMRS